MSDLHPLFRVAPCTRKDSPDPGVRLLRNLGGAQWGLSPDEARSLAADLVLAANASEAQWDAPAPRAGERT